MNAVRETAAPWYLKQAEFGGIAIVLSKYPDDGKHWPYDPKYAAGWGELPWVECNPNGCGLVHEFSVGRGNVYEGDSLEEAEAAYAELERQLLAGELAVRQERESA